MAARLTSERIFSLLVFDVEGFTALQEQFGEDGCGQILTQLGAALACQVRARDFVCRWIEDKFLVILDCGLAQAMLRSKHIAQWLSGRYRVEVRERESILPVMIQVRCAQRAPGDTVELLLERVGNLVQAPQAVS